MPRSRPTHPAIPAAAINTATALTRPDEVFGKGKVSPRSSIRAAQVLGEYSDHYNGHRPHRALHQKPPARCQDPPAAGSSTRVLRWYRLGGLIHEYAQVA